MFPRQSRRRRVLRVARATFAALVILLSTVTAVHLSLPRGGAVPAGGGAAPPSSSILLSRVLGAPLAEVGGGSADEAAAGAIPLASPASAEVPVLLTLGFANSSTLASLLTALVDPGSSQFHRYLSASDFAERFAPNGSGYSSLVGYLGSFGIRPITQYPDRLAVSFSASPAALSAAFHAAVGRFASAGSAYWAFESAPELPRPLADAISAVSGLGVGSGDLAIPLGSVVAPAPSSPGAPVTPQAPSGYLSPVTVGGVQYVYPSDLQIGYDEESLFDLYGFPTNSSVAALVWAGEYTGTTTIAACGGRLAPDQSVGPYDPADISNFLESTTPSGEPTGSVVAVPVAGSPNAGCRASYDSTGVVAANTAELEALAAVAPGASIYAVAAPGPSLTELETAFASALSPPSNVSAAVRDGLANLSVLAVGWGTTDTNASAWTSSLDQAEARGITVVAAAGNSGDDPASSAWVGTRAEFPASDAVANVGSLAVGGTTVKLNASTLHLSGQVVWYVAPGDAAAGGPLGSTGGVSTVYPEPKFQKDTTANKVLKGAGRGVPDVAAMANNSLVTVTINGTQYRATNASSGDPFRFAEGTGVACGLVAGLLAVVDHTLRAAGNGLLGYVDPTVYAVADEEYSLPTANSVKVAPPPAGYDYGLPTTPFRDVSSGHNDVYSAAVGYDLVTGWGSPDAYNLTMYVLSVRTSFVYGDLAAVEDLVHLTALKVTSIGPGGGVNKVYNASIQQNFFVANSLGAPVYWVQSVVYLHRHASAWAMNFTAWVVYPFWGLYPNLTVFEYRFPSAGELEGLPLTLTLLTTLVPAKGSTPAELKFTYGVPGAPVLTIDVPGATFIVGRAGYSYSWQGATFTDGPRVTGSPHGFLAPQLVVVGAPSDGTGHFGPTSKGYVTALLEPSGSSSFLAAQLELVNTSNTQSAESAVDLGFTLGGANTVHFAYTAGASTDGVLQVEAPWYPVKFVQSGMPAAGSWYVNISGGPSLVASGAVPSLTTSVPNATYSWTASSGVHGISPTPDSGSITVAGKPTTVTLTFGTSVGSVTFNARGPVKDGVVEFVWYVNITNQPSHAGTLASYTTNLSYGTYDYKVAASNHSYFPDKGTGSVVISKAPQTIYATFTLKTYLIEFNFQLPKSPPRLTITLAGVSETGSFASWGVDEPNGTYSWSITNVPLGYAVSPSKGVVVVQGPVTAISVSVTEPGWGPFGLGVTGYAIVVGGPALLAIWLGVARSRRRASRASREVRRKQPPGERKPPHPSHNEIRPEEI